MKKLLWLVLLLPMFAKSQNTNGTLQRQIASPNAITGVFGATRDSLYNRAQVRALVATSSPDTTVYQTVSNFFPKGDTRYAKGVGTAVLTTTNQTVSGNKTLNDTLRVKGVIINSTTGNTYKQDSGADEAGPNLYMNRTITTGATGNEHGIIDFNTFSRATKAYNSYDAQTRISGTSFDHYTGFQARPVINISGTIGEVHAFESAIEFPAGTATTVYHFWGRPVSGSGTIGTEYGVYIPTLKGSTKYSFYSADATATIFNTGDIVSGTKGTLYGTATGSITSSQLRTSLTDETGTGSAVFATSPTLVTPNIGAATGTSVNLSGGATIAGAVLVNNNDITQDGTRPILTMKQSGTTKMLTGVADSGDDFITGTVSGDVAYRKNGGNFLWSVDNGSTAALKVASDNTVRVTTQSPNDNSTKVATTAYVDAATGGGLTFDSDTYNPTLTNGANVSSSAATTNHYIRVGNQVSISGKVNVTPTAAAGTNTVISLSLPVASNFANQADVSGIVNVYNNVSATAIGIVNANSGTDLIEINFGSLATTGHTISYSLQYTVL